MRRRLGIGAVLAAVALTLSGCFVGSGPVRPTSTPAPQDVSAELAPFYGQTLIWTDCGDGAQCTTASVPLDWADPAASTASIALVRYPARSGTPIGSLLVDPGGPGASGYDFVRDSVDYAVDGALRDRYDIVGLDPRGVGRSTAVACYDAPEMDAFLYDIVPGERGSDEWIAGQQKTAAAFAAACQARSGPLLPHVDTISAARDLDVLRAALGDARLNYLGYSYGTFLGASYAGLYPDRVGRMVLDGALDPAASSLDVVTEQAKGFESALRAYLADCLARSGCPFDGTVDEGMAAVRSLLDGVDASPIRANDGRELGSSTLLTAIIYPLYDAAGWSSLSEMFAAVRSGDPETAFQFADSYNGRAAGGGYTDNSTEAFLAINCVDYAYTSDLATLRAEAAQIELAAPIIGRYMAYGDLQCDAWPTSFTGVRAPITAEGAAPILVVGTTNDPATPYVWAQSLAAQLSSGHLVSYDGEGHTAYNKSNSCVNDAVDAYLIEGTVPAADPRC